MKIAFAASRDLGVKIIEWVYLNQKQFNATVIGGVSPQFKGWWGDEVKELYSKLNIQNYSDLETMIQDTRPDIIFSINYWKIIPESIIKKVKFGIVNIHHSYKLRFRGRYSTSWAIINARKDNNWYHGSTLHYIDKELDSGKIIATKKISILENDTAETLFFRIEKLALKMFKDNFSNIINQSLKHISHDKIHYYYDKDSNKNLEINLDWSSEEIYDFVRAWTFKDRLGPYIKYKNKKIFLKFDKNKD